MEEKTGIGYGPHLAATAALWGPSLDYGTYLTIALTCAIIGITTVAILVAALAIWGYRGLKDEAGRIAKREARRAVIGLIRRGNIKTMLEDEVRNRVGIEADMVFSGIQYGVGQNLEAVDCQGAQGSPVAGDYPHGEEDVGHGNK